MRIALYFSPLWGVSGPLTGVGQHIVQMADQIACLPDVTELRLLVSKSAFADHQSTLPEALTRLPRTFIPGSENLMRKVQLLSPFFPVDRWAPDADWIYCPKEQPVNTRKAKLAVTVHDVATLETNVDRLPRPSSREVMRWRMTLSRVIARADLIPIVSEFTAGRFCKLLGIPRDRRIRVIGSGVSADYFRTAQSSDADVLSKYQLAAGGYLLAVGALIWRKGGDTLLDLAKLIRQRKLDLQIAVVGAGHDADLLTRFEQMRREDPALPMRLLGFVPVGELPPLYSQALALAFPSRYEGFGIPPLEAMAAGTPVICSNRAAIPEVVGSAGIYCAADSAEQILQIVRDLEANSGFRSDLIAAGRARANEFTWDRCASRLVDALKEA